MSDNISIDVLAQLLANPRRKDGWDKLAVVVPFLAAILSTAAIGVVGLYFTNAYKGREVKIAEIQAVEKMLTHLTGTNETAKNGAIIVLATLGNEELATRLGVSFASPGTIDALEYMLKHAQRDSKTLVRQALVKAYSIHAQQIVDNRKDTKLALQDYARIHELERDDELAKNYENGFLSDLYNRRADIYHSEGKYDLAVNDYKKAIQFAPDDYVKGIALANLAGTYTAQGNFVEARSTFELAFKTTTPTRGMYTLRAWFYSKQEDFAKAIEYSKRALDGKIDEGNIYAFYILMHTYAKKDDYQNAAREFIKVRSRLMDPKLQEDLEKHLERAQQDAGNPTFTETVKQEMETMKPKEQPTPGKAEAKP
jgi:tetratricopeptide (TPR) repeat protein